MSRLLNHAYNYHYLCTLTSLPRHADTSSSFTSTVAKKNIAFSFDQRLCLIYYIFACLYEPRVLKVKFIYIYGCSFNVTHTAVRLLLTFKGTPPSFAFLFIFCSNVNSTRRDEMGSGGGGWVGVCFIILMFVFSVSYSRKLFEHPNIHKLTEILLIPSMLRRLSKFTYINICIEISYLNGMRV